jgi:ABC-type transport system involved in multi-copper enzyme maturation permease subunit
MLMGPVFRAELLRTARQRRYYLLRLVYGMVLLFLVRAAYEGMNLGAGPISLADVARFASATFIRFAVVQLVTILLLVPAVFGGAIADEKQRKTLHYIMASQLSSGEIILDKVLGRSAHLAVFVAIGLPVVSFLRLFGGISAESVAAAYLGTISSVAFAIALTVLVSTLARRVRDAILCSYLLMLFWLFVPPLIFLFGTAFRHPLYLQVQPIIEWLADSSPVSLGLRAYYWMPLRTTMPMMVERFLWMFGIQLAGAGLLLLLAIWRLRPTFRRQEETASRRDRSRSWGLRRRSRPFARPECGADPIFWKERYFAPADRATRGLLLTVVILITIVLALMTEHHGGRRVVLTILRFGFGGLAGLRPMPEDFLWALQVDLGWFLAFWLLAVAGASASSVAIEREQGTWASLTSTPLTGREILRAKVIGAIWHQRGFAFVLIFIWVAGLITGMAHPVAVFDSIALTALLTWFVATVGVYWSLRASSTSRALAATLATLAAFNGYPILLVLFLQRAIGWEASYSILGFMPSIPAWVMVSPQALSAAWTSVTTAAITPPMTIFFAAMGLSMLFIFAATGLALTRRIIGQLDLPDRPPAAPRATPPRTGR